MTSHDSLLPPAARAVLLPIRKHPRDALKAFDFLWAFHASPDYTPGRHPLIKAGGMEERLKDFRAIGGAAGHATKDDEGRVVLDLATLLDWDADSAGRCLLRFLPGEAPEGVDRFRILPEIVDQRRHTRFEFDVNMPEGADLATWILSDSGAAAVFRQLQRAADYGEKYVRRVFRPLHLKALEAFLKEGPEAVEAISLAERVNDPSELRARAGGAVALLHLRRQGGGAADVDLDAFLAAAGAIHPALTERSLRWIRGQTEAAAATLKAETADGSRGS